MSARIFYLPGLPFEDAPTLEEHVADDDALEREKYQAQVRRLREQRKRVSPWPSQQA